MDINSSLMFFNKFKDDNMSLLYSGNFSDDVTTRFIDLSEFNIESHNELTKMRKKVTFLMAECFQNIVRHGENPENKKKDDNTGFFLTKNIEKNFYISSGNLINKKNITQLENQLKIVNSLNRGELKDLYRKVMANEEFSTKGGAGLGLIDMARRSGEKIEYYFKDYNDKFSLFYNQISIKRNDKDADLSDSESFSIEDSVEFHRIMDENHLLLIQKGDFSQDSILPILNIIEQNFKEDTVLKFKNKRAYHVLVELLQNISKHSLKTGDQHEGIFLIGRKGSKFVVMAGNYVESSKVNDFKRRLEIIKSLDKDDLRDLYLKELTEGEGTEKAGAGIGLIDISRESSEPIQYSFQEIDQNKMFFSIQIKI